MVLDISWKTIFKMVITGFSLYLIFLLRDVLVLIIFALIISILFNPAIEFLQRYKIPRILAAVLIYIGMFSILGFFVYLTIPVFVAELKQFSQFFPQYFEKLAPPLKGLGLETFNSFDSFVNGLGEMAVKASSSIFSAVSMIFGGIFSTIIIFTIAIFLSFEEKAIEKMVATFSPKKYEAYILDLWHRSQTKVSAWFGSKILTALFIGVFTFIACKILAVKYAISFAFIAGIFNIIPLFGPIVSGAVIFIFTALDSWTKAIFIMIAFVLLQQIEGNIITPILTRKFVGIPAVLVLIALLVGSQLWGVLGAILAIPLAGVMFEFLKDFLKKKKEEKTVVI
ncbi:MAG: AI-2E family transporter [Candidatus Nealsonbacteria bacterium]|nr:AI-2E family transporter [Candidatus Nealsonbacteria bacterium]